MKNYRFNHILNEMTDSEVASKLDAYEIELRTGAFTYNPSAPSLDQLRSFISDWSKEDLLSMRKMSESLGLGQKIPASAAKQMIFKTLDSIIAPKISINSNFTENNGRFLVCEAALCLLFGIKSSKENLSTGTIKFNNKTIAIKTSSNLNKIIVNSEQIDKADIYVYALYNKDLYRPMFVGYETKEVIKTYPKGNRITDPSNCSWSTMAYYNDYKNLKPMNALLKELNIKELYSGILFEQIPDVNKVPILSNLVVGSSPPANQRTSAQIRDDFLKSLGVTPKIPESIGEAAPKDEVPCF